MLKMFYSLIHTKISAQAEKKYIILLSTWVINKPGQNYPKRINRYIPKPNQQTY